MKKQPHIIVVDTDQQRAEAMRCSGSPWMATPNLDRLAADGVRFSSAFSCAATCISSRGAFYAGLYPHLTGVYSFARYTGRMNWTHRLKAAGYRCVSIGKTHINGGEHGYDERIGDQCNKCSPHYDDGTGKQTCLWAEELAAAGYGPPLNLHETMADYDDRLCAVEWSLPAEWHPDLWLGDKAVGWIEGYDFTRPTFLHIGFLGPHDPYDPVPRYLELYADADIPLPEVTEDELAGIPEDLFVSNERRERMSNMTAIKGSHATPDRLRRMRKCYYANVTMIDETIGRIVEALQRKGVFEEAVIVFTSDHGDHLGDHGLYYKGDLFDTIVKVPLIVRAPDLAERGRIVDDLVSQLDVARYLLDVASVPADGLSGISLRGTLEQGTPHQRKYVFAEEGASVLRPAPDILTMVRSAEHKMIHFAGRETGQLFDLDADPGETRNLWHDAGYRDVRHALTAELLDWMCATSYAHRDLFQESR